MVNMIKVKIKKEGSNYRQINVIGHAMYDDYGKDIVCSAASSIMTTTVNGILSFDQTYITYQEEKDRFTIIINYYNTIVNNLIDNMIRMFKELEGDYPDNIKIEEE